MSHSLPSDYLIQRRLGVFGVHYGGPGWAATANMHIFRLGHAQLACAECIADHIHALI